MATQVFSPTGLRRQIFRARWLIFELVSRELRLRYRGSVLGFAWTLLNPLLFMGVYVLVFGVYLRMGFHNYALYLLTGNITFNWFSSSINAATTSIRDNRVYVAKTVFPPEILVMLPTFSNFVNFLLALPVLIVADIIFHQPLGLPIVALPLVMLAELIMTIGLSFMFATFFVFYRDMKELVTYIVMVLLFLSPIFYRLDSVPAQYQHYVLLNPLALMITSYQDILYFNTFPHLAPLAALYAFALGVFFLGHRVFNRFKECFGEYV